MKPDNNNNKKKDGINGGKHKAMALFHTLHCRFLFQLLLFAVVVLFPCCCCWAINYKSLFDESEDFHGGVAQQRPRNLCPTKLLNGSPVVDGGRLEPRVPVPIPCLIFFYRRADSLRQKLTEHR